MDRLDPNLMSQSELKEEIKELRKDAERLDTIEKLARQSRTGISFDYIPSTDGERSGFRLTTRHNIREAHDSIRMAIDAANLVKTQVA